ncbi:RecQ family ATP-dependent DNA helicase [Methylobacter sp.]|uniref:RecQ family ATP-dependent DNA helicase n=1 Tax=Methylobacter sp. TaxID=2051955 RepID=UPI0024891BE8|nr:RecQ family ATP-dependent DNA helicase [Methylobacter sp.]MDI1276199.1 RecQ family ATP-dependent DNA helicase [Methylobacter sp.]MDI1356913.1 RecQ family ATP-dependent DNA helicase [Methylobacter sp.]
MDWQTFQNSCCSLDLETNENGEIFAIGAVFNDKTFQRKAPFNVQKILAEFDDFARDATYLLGHNILEHDLPVCRSISSQLKFLSKPVADTLLLSPLAFPENPYHRLVKDYKLVRDSLNDPLADARLALSLFHDQWEALQQQQAEGGLLDFYHCAFSGNTQFFGVQLALSAMGAKAVDAVGAFDLFTRLTLDKVCSTAIGQMHKEFAPATALAYCLAWLRVAGGNSVLPPWVRLRFDDVAPTLNRLREVPCNDPACSYCAQMHNPVIWLEQYFGFAGFRPEPPAADGGSLQEQIVKAAMCGKPLFAILPTGGGKSLCFQLPALVRYQRRGVLTIVVSPLQALMKDQVDNLRNKTGAPNAAALYGMLTAPERGEVLQGIQNGDIALLYVSPEQLRNLSFQKAIEYREIGCWVFDEAHCLSKWGHDFRPDYLYAARFIKEFALRQKAVLPPVQCFTATAKQDVKDEIIDYFKAELAQDLAVFEGGVERDKLHFEVQTVNGADKYPRINSLLTERLSPEPDGGSAIIYCSTRKNTEEIAEYLQQQGWQVEAFHAGKDTAEKKHIQENFVTGTTRVITATNAFGMGIDKEDVRLVIHADIPGSIENYLQEAGRAGRDQKDAECVLLFDENDIETQFKLSASSQISQRDIAQILRGLRKSKKDKSGNVVLTTGELLMDDDVQTSFDNEDHAADTKVKMAVSWLERCGFIQRNENLTQVFQGRPLIKNMDEAKSKVEKLDLSQRQQQRWLAILEALFNAESDEGFSADELALHGAFKDGKDDYKRGKIDQTASQRVIRTLYDMAKAGLIQKSLLLTAFVRYKVSNSSLAKLEEVCALERVMLKALQEQAPDADNGQWQTLSLRHLNQSLLNNGHENSNPEILRLLLGSLAKDGKGLAGKKGSLTLRHKGLDQYAVKLNRGWTALNATAEIRQAVAKVVLDGIMQRIPDHTKPSADLLVEFSAEDLLAVLNQDLVASSEVRDPLAAVERALNFLHEQKIITLQKGLAVFRSAMTIEVLPEAKGRQYNKGDFEPLSQHYSERIFQVHVINEYAKYGLDKISHALAFVVAYFSTDKTEFVKRYFSDRKDILERATSQQSFQRIVGDLQNPEQMALVAGGEDDNLLILAGPGSGKTRVVVHRCAYLLRVKRIPAKGILVLCFNRNAVTQLRRRLLDLVGDDARGVTIQTYHGLSLRLTGHAITTQSGDNRQFAEIINEAIALLRGDKQLLGVDADETRERLLAGYRYILVDEYQDIDAEQYQLISAIAGRTQDEDRKLGILAVGDDDQNIYQFRGANVEFIRQFKDDYQAKVHYLVENYRSSAHIIAAANQLIQHNRDRMKQQQPIRINRSRKTLDAGGRWQKLDPVGKGRVQQLISVDEYSQAVAVVDELLRLRQLDSRLDWSQCAVLATAWRLLDPVRTLLEQHDIPISIMLPADKQPPLSRIRENADLLDAIKQSPDPLSKAGDWLRYLDDGYGSEPANIWLIQLKAVLQDWQDETDDGAMPKLQILEFLYEVLAEQRRERCLGKGVFLSTVHSVKGMEFAHLAIVDGGWVTPATEEQRRLFYVAMTRAKETLCLIQRQDQRNPFLAEIIGDHLLARAVNLPSQTGTLTKQYAILGMKDVDLSYAGSFDASQPIHQHLARLNTGSRLSMENNNGKVVLKDQDRVVAVLSKQGAQFWSAKINAIESVTVLAMVRRYREDSEEGYQSRCKVEQWELPLVEVVFGDTSIG